MVDYSLKGRQHAVSIFGCFVSNHLGVGIHMGLHMDFCSQLSLTQWPAGWSHLPILHGRHFRVGHYMQTCLPNSVVPAMLKGINNFCLFFFF